MMATRNPAPRLAPGCRLVALDSVGSTNDEAKRLAGEGAGHLTFVWAGEQTAGRGRRGRAWHSPRGNLYVSVVLRPRCPVPKAMELGFVAGLAIADALASLAPAIPGRLLKWPNDVLLGGRKVAGILVESEAPGAGPVEWVVLGSGVNVASYPSRVERPATSLAAEGCEVAVEALLGAYSERIVAWTEVWTREGFPPVRRSWLDRAVGLGEAVEVRLHREVLKGIFAGMDDQGALLLDQPGGRRAVTVGEVFAGAAA